MPIEYLDGARFRRAVIAGADWVRRRREHLNRINVFPVPDGDTGTNMALSLLATAEGARTAAAGSLGEVAAAAAEASVLGAKGNSGVIMAHWFIGLELAFRGVERVGARRLGAGFESAAESVRGAIESPVEGTVLSVMSAAGQNASAEAAEGMALEELLTLTHDAAERALARTPEQLPALARAGVVDAGGQGFVDFLHGILRATDGKPVRLERSAPISTLPGHALEHGYAASTGGRYCTEVVLRGNNLDERRVRRALASLGTSLLVAGAGAVVKVHLHTDRPDAAIAKAARFGEVVERKVDDMQRQQRERGSEPAPVVPLEQQPMEIAVICDSTADLQESVRRQHGIELTPLQILFGDEVFRDQVDLSTEEFYRRLLAGPHHPTTSQPPPRAFVESLDRIRPDREAIVLTLSSSLSGTHESARRAAALAAHPRVEVFDSASVSLGLGLMVVNAARLAATGASMVDLLAWLGRWRADTGAVFSVATLEYLRRGGRIGRARSMLASLLGVRPVLGLRQGKLVAIGRIRSDSEAVEHVLAEIEANVPVGEQLRVGLIEVERADGVRDVESALRDRYEVVEILHGAPTGVIGAHAGPGAWGVFYQRVRPDDPLL